MKIVQYDDVEWKRGLQHRGGTFHYRHLLNGTPGTLGNFQFNIGQLRRATSPRRGTGTISINSASSSKAR